MSSNSQEVPGAPTLEQVQALEAQVAELQRELRQLREEMARGYGPDRVAAAIRSRCQAMSGFDKYHEVIRVLLSVAEEIEREAR